MSTTVELAYWRSTRCSRWAEELRCIVSGCHRSAGLPRPATIPHFMRRPPGFIASWRYLSLKNMLYMSTESSSVPWVDRFKITVSIVGPKIERSLLSVRLCLYVVYQWRRFGLVIQASNRKHTQSREEIYFEKITNEIKTRSFLV